MAFYWELNGCLWQFGSISWGVKFLFGCFGVVFCFGACFDVFRWLVQENLVVLSLVLNGVLALFRRCMTGLEAYGFGGL